MNGLEQEYEGSLECDVLDATVPESVAKIREYELGNHGMVIYDAHGNVGKTLGGHKMTEAEIRQALKEVMEGA